MNRRGEDILKAYAEYEREHPNGGVDIDKFAAWLLENKRWDIERPNILSLCKKEVTKVLRQQYIKDERGRKVRAKLTTKEKQGEIRWHDLRTIPHPKMRNSVGHRRKQAAHDVYQLKLQLEFYAEHHSDRPHIYLSYDFTEDMQEMDAERGVKQPEPEPTEEPEVILN